MTQHCFDTQMARLKETYGARTYGPGREELILKSTRHLHDYAFEKIVSRFIADSRQAPLPKDFIDAANRERGGHQRLLRDNVADPIRCEWCNDGGVIEVTHTADSKEYFMRCDCENHLPERERTWAKHFRTELPYWGGDMEKFFTRHKMYGPRALKWRPRRFDPGRILESTHDVVERWKLKLKVSAVFWRELERDSGGAGA